MAAEVTGMAMGAADSGFNVATGLSVSKIGNTRPARGIGLWGRQPQPRRALPARLPKNTLI